MYLLIFILQLYYLLWIIYFTIIRFIILLNVQYSRALIIRHSIVRQSLQFDTKVVNMTVKYFVWADIFLKKVMFVKWNCCISLVSLFKVEVIVDIYHYWKWRKLHSTLCGLHVIFLLPQKNPLKHKQKIINSFIRKLQTSNTNRMMRINTLG